MGRILKTLKQLIEISNEVHKGKYKYHLIKDQPKNMKQRVLMFCMEHGEFQQSFGAHIQQRQVCPKCSYKDRNRNRKLSQEEFEKRIEEVFPNNMLDLSECIFNNTSQKVKLICHTKDKDGIEHGSFMSLPFGLFNGHGCPKCGIERRSKLQERSLEKLLEDCKNEHKDKYDYSLIIERKNSNEKMPIICHKKDIYNEEHGIFYQTPSEHIYSKAGCPKCYNERRSLMQLSTIEDYRNSMRQKFGDDRADNIISFNGTGKNGVFVCHEKYTNGEEHGEYEQRAGNHLYLSAGCPICFKSGKSKLEKEVYDFVLQYCSDAKNGLRTIISPKELDIYIPSIKLGIEFDGLYWHSELKTDKNEHKLKTDLCEKKGIHLIQIFEDDWKNKRTIIESRLLNLFHKTSTRIYARQCEIKEVDQSIGKKFLESNHLQGYSSFQIGYGLYFENELVSLMTFGNRRVCLGKSTSDIGDYELMRFASKINCIVIGSAERLFKHFIKENNPKSVVSYADRFWTMNNGKTVYDKMGFKLDGITPPNYYYIVNGVRKHRFGFRKAKLIKDGFDPKLSEREIMESRGILRIFNSGNLRYVWKSIEALAQKL